MRPAAPITRRLEEDPEWAHLGPIAPLGVRRPLDDLGTTEYAAHLDQLVHPGDESGDAVTCVVDA